MFCPAVEAAYRQDSAINNSLIADFNQSPDFALMRMRESGTKYFFEIGKAYERMLFDAVSGFKTFHKEFFISYKLNGEPSEDIMNAVAEGKDLRDMVKRTKDGTPDKRYSAIHNAIDECLENPGRMPIRKCDYDMLSAMTDNMLRMEVAGFGRVMDFLGICHWQVPIYWDDKKALADCLFNDGTEQILFDVKTTCSVSDFVSKLKSNYWIQDIHYCEGADRVFGNCIKPMVFLVAEKKPPYICHSFATGDIEEQSPEDHERRHTMKMRYAESVENLRKWKAAGMPTVGWKHFRTIKVYPY